MEGSELVSIIIPVYNAAQYVVEAIDSILNQSYDYLEIIVIDDGSTDGSGKICDDYAERDKLIHLIHQENKGISAARDVELDLMTGEAVAFIDADDAVAPDFIASMMSAMVYAKSDLVICRFFLYTSTGRLKDKPAEKIKPRIEHGIYDRVDALRALVNGDINAGVWNKPYSSKLWKDIRFPEGHIYEEIDTAYRIIDICNIICVIEEPLYSYRIRPGSITDTTSPDSINDWLLSCQHFEEFIEEIIPDLFTQEQLKKNRQSRLRYMLKLYKRGVSNQHNWREWKSYNEKHRKTVHWTLIGLYNKVGIGDCSFRMKLFYCMIRYCPKMVRFVGCII